MKTTFTDINWRNNDDMNIFNLHALKSITLDGFTSGVVTIEGVSGKFQAPYYDLTFGGGVDHYEFKTKHPYQIGEYLFIAIFDGKVATAHCESYLVNSSFQYRCRTFVASF